MRNQITAFIKEKKFKEVFELFTQPDNYAKIGNKSAFNQLKKQFEFNNAVDFTFEQRLLIWLNSEKQL